MKIILLTSLAIFVQAIDIQLCTGSGMVISEYYGDLFTDVVRNNTNEQFTYNETSKTIVAKTNGECIQYFPLADYKYYWHTKTAPCNHTNPLQKWTMIDNHIKSYNGEYCFKANPFQQSFPLMVYPCELYSDALYSPSYFIDCSKVNANFVRIVSSRNKRISEHEGDVYFNFPKDNFNELFWWNSTTQMFKNPMRGDCLDSYLDVDGKYKIHMYACSEDNPNQKWIVHADTKKIEHATHKGQCLHGDPNYEDHRVRLWECLPDNINQIWTLEKIVP